MNFVKNEYTWTKADLSAFYDAINEKMRDLDPNHQNLAVNEEPENNAYKKQKRIKFKISRHLR